MIDFKKLLDQNREMSGKCFIPTHRYLSIPGIEAHHTTGVEIIRDIYFLIDPDRWGSPTIEFLNGVTGYESFFVKDMIECRDSDYIWLCAGTEGKYNSLKVLRAIIHNHLRDFGYMD